MHGRNGPLHSCGFKRVHPCGRAGVDLLFRTHAVQVIAERMRVRGKPIQGTMHILARVNTTRPHMWKHFLQRHHLLFGLMAAVVDYDINPRYLLAKAFPESAICLITDEDARVVGLELSHSSAISMPYT